MRKLIFALLAFSILSCQNHQPKAADNPPEEVDTICCCPPTIHLQPYNNFTLKEAEQVKKQFAAYLKKSLYYEEEIEIDSPIKLDTSMLNAAHSRYRADKIVNYQRKQTNSHNIIIGLLHEDISLQYKGRKDWGVLGLSFKGTYSCVVSTYRVKNKQRDLWKVVAHEFIHAYFNYGHCPKDNPNCIMKDAKGHADFSNKNDLCDYCKQQLRM